MPVSFPFFYRTTKPRDKKPMQAKMVKDEEDLKRLGWGTDGDNCISSRDETFFIHQAAINMSLMAPLMAARNTTNPRSQFCPVRELLFISRCAASPFRSARSRNSDEITEKKLPRKLKLIISEDKNGEKGGENKNLHDDDVPRVRVLQLLEDNLPILSCIPSLYLPLESSLFR
jgi:hypothetical protein